MIYGLMADLHLHRWSAFATTTPEGLNSRLNSLLLEIERCAREVMDAGGKHVVMAGDVFHVRGSVAPSVLNPTIDCLRRLHKLLGTEFIIMPGNHDLEGRESERIGSAVVALEGPGVNVATRLCWHDDTKTIMVPWIEDTEKLMKEISEYANSITDASEWDLILHAPVDGVIEGLPLHGVSPEYLATLGYRRVFVGHYHNHKVMADGKVVSIGALAHHNWSDVGSKAGFLLVNSSTGEFSWRKSHLPEFIDLARLVDLDPEDIPLLVDRNYVRVKVTADKAKMVEAARKELLDMGALAVLVQAEPAAPTREGGVSATVASGASLETSVAEFIKGMKKDNEPAVMKAALDVLSTVEA